MENNMNYTYGAPQTPLNNGAGLYAPPVQKKKDIPGMLLLVISAIVGSLPDSLGTTAVNMLLSFFSEVENISVLSTALQSAVDSVGCIFLMAIVGGAGYLWSKSLRGALKFLACWKAATLLSNAAGNILFGIVWMIFGKNINATMGIILSAVSYVSIAFEIAFLCLFFAFFERLEKKELSKIIPVPFAYEGFAPIPEKKSFNILNTVITVAATSVISYLISLSVLPLVGKLLSHSSYMYSAVQYFTGSGNKILTLLCLVGLSFLLTKSAKSAVSICGVYALSNLLAGAVTAFSRFVFILITGSFTSGAYVTFNFVLNICGIILTAVIAVLAVSLLSKKKDFAQ